MKALPQLHIRSIEARPVLVPMTRPLHTTSGAVTQAPMLLIDLQAEEGVVGRSYLFGYQPFTLKPLHELVTAFAAMIAGDRVAPFDLDRKLRSSVKLLGPYHLAGMAIAGLDMACWDALAVAQGLALVELLGGSTGSVPAYNSNGLGIMPAETAASEAVQLVDEGFHAIKIRLGRATAAEDLAAVRAVRSRITSDVLLMADFNQALSVNEAIHRGRLLEGEGLVWIEEPVRADDLA